MRWLGQVSLAALAAWSGAASAQTAPAEDEIVVTATRGEERLQDVPASVVSQDIEKLRQLGFTNGSEEFRGLRHPLAARSLKFDLGHSRQR